MTGLPPDCRCRRRADPFITSRMKALSLLLAVVPLLGVAAESSHPFHPRIERLDPAFDALVAPNVRIEKLAEGFVWSEGPVWIDGTLIFSDVPTNVAYRWRPGQTQAEVFLKPSGGAESVPGVSQPGSNGLGRDAQGRLLICQQATRRIVRYVDGRFTVLVDRYEGKRFNSPNDLALRRNGDLYFTDPPYGLAKEDASPIKELPFNGVFRLSPDGRVTLLLKHLTRPNGIGFSPDEKTLYISISDPRASRVMAYDVQPDGTLAGERLLYNAQPLFDAGAHGNPDGLKVDRNGNVWCAGADGILVISPAGRLLGRLITGEPCGNCNWGGDGSTLYIASNMFLVRVQTLTRGAGW